MGFPWGIVVVLKRDWTPISRIRIRYEFDGSGRLFFPELIVLQKDTIAWLPRQESFRKAGDYREWVYIALYYPSLPVLLDANGSGSIHWDSLEDYEHPHDERLVEIPVSHLSAEVFILRDFVPRVPEHDTLAARYPPGEVGIFLKGDIATHEGFSMHHPMILRVHGAGWTVDGQRRHCLIPHSLVRYGPPPTELPLDAFTNANNTLRMSSSSSEPPPEQTPIAKHPGSTSNIAPRVTVRPKEEWTEYSASFAFLVHPTTRPFRSLAAGTKAPVALSQKPRGLSDSPLITIRPVQQPETGLAYILPRVDARVDVTTPFLRIGIRIVKDYGPGVPEFDSMTPIMLKTSTKTSTNTTQTEKESSKAGDIAVCDHFAIDVAFGIEQAIPRDFVEYGLQMTGPVAVKN
ncbi:hypothetical protein CMEL01_10389 [Colletotrichum melonis]|uniref:Uncharacterized protein n=1 Tax=Colletotrichum melonis TaxID=1209925 RepID=A0AAI9TWL3_9PEZI|nr:hypothetical protein CMEL01_10389 [Colletotrichum melonis]